MNRRRTAYSIARTGMARMRDDHLVAANEPLACRACTNTCDEGKNCDGGAALARGTLLMFVRVVGPYLAAIALALFLAAAPALLDGQGPQQETSR